VSTVNHLDLILVVYTNRPSRIWTDSVNKQGFKHNNTLSDINTMQIIVFFCGVQSFEEMLKTLF